MIFENANNSINNSAFNESSEIQTNNTSKIEKE